MSTFEKDHVYFMVLSEINRDRRIALALIALVTTAYVFHLVTWARTKASAQIVNQLMFPAIKSVLIFFENWK